MLPPPTQPDAQHNPQPHAARRHQRDDRRPHPRRARAGFTLLETMFALMIIGLGVVVILRSMVSFLHHNAWSTHAATATYLASEVRELTRNLPRHDRFAGGLYFETADSGTTLRGWGAEPGEADAQDIDDIDDLDGVVFGQATTFPEGFTMTRRLPGPINAFGEAISETLWDGTIETIDLDGETAEIAMRGWSQLVTVRKVDPYDYTTIVANETFVDGARDVDQYPLLVTVTIVYDGVWEDTAPAITSVSWIVPP